MFANRRPPVDHLEDLKLFSSCAQRELEQIASVCDVVPVEKGKVLTKEGRSGTECFIVREGEASVLIGGREVARVGRGDVIGEMSVIDGGTRSATVVALTPMKVVVFSRPAFQAVLATHKGVATAILKLMSGRVRSAQELAYEKAR